MISRIRKWMSKPFSQSALFFVDNTEHKHDPLSTNQPTMKTISYLVYRLWATLLVLSNARVVGGQTYFGGYRRPVNGTYDDKLVCLPAGTDRTNFTVDVPECPGRLTTGAGAAVSIGIVALLWLTASIYAITYRPKHGSYGDELSENGDTEVSSVVTIENEEVDPEQGG